LIILTLIILILIILILGSRSRRGYHERQSYCQSEQLSSHRSILSCFLLKSCFFSSRALIFV
jgi:hypothetical protein